MSWGWGGSSNDSSSMYGGSTGGSSYGTQAQARSYESDNGGSSAVSRQRASWLREQQANKAAQEKAAREKAQIEKAAEEKAQRQQNSVERNQRAKVSSVDSRNSRATQRDVTERRNIDGDEPEFAEISDVDPTTGARAFAVPMMKATTRDDGSVSLGNDYSGFNKNVLSAWGDNPWMATNYAGVSDAEKARIRSGVAYSQDNGWGGKVASVVGMFVPGVGLLGNAAIDAKQTRDFSRDAWGEEPTATQTLSDMGNIAGLGLSKFVGGTLAQKLGGLAGSKVAGGYGGLIGSMAGQKYGGEFMDDQVLSSFMNGDNSPSTAPSFDSDFGSGDSTPMYATNNQPQPALPPQAATQAANVTGFDSKFGNYDAHLKTFGGYRQRATQAWS